MNRSPYHQVRWKRTDPPPPPMAAGGRAVFPFPQPHVAFHYQPIQTSYSNGYGDYFYVSPVRSSTRPVRRTHMNHAGYRHRSPELITIEDASRHSPGVYTRSSNHRNPYPTEGNWGQGAVYSCGNIGSLTRPPYRVWPANTRTTTQTTPREPSHRKSSIPTSPPFGPHNPHAPVFEPSQTTARVSRTRLQAPPGFAGSSQRTTTNGGRLCNDINTTAGSEGGDFGMCVKGRISTATLVAQTTHPGVSIGALSSPKPRHPIREGVPDEASAALPWRTHEGSLTSSNASTEVTTQLTKSQQYPPSNSVKNATSKSVGSQKTTPKLSSLQAAVNRCATGVLPAVEVVAVKNAASGSVVSKTAPLALSSLQLAASHASAANVKTSSSTVLKSTSLQRSASRSNDACTTTALQLTVSTLQHAARRKPGGAVAECPSKIHKSTAPKMESNWTSLQRAVKESSVRAFVNSAAKTDSSVLQRSSLPRDTSASLAQGSSQSSEASVEKSTSLFERQNTAAGVIRKAWRSYALQARADGVVPMNLWKKGKRQRMGEKQRDKLKKRVQANKLNILLAQGTFGHSEACLKTAASIAKRRHVAAGIIHKAWSAHVLRAHTGGNLSMLHCHKQKRQLPTSGQHQTGVSVASAKQDAAVRIIRKAWRAYALRARAGGLLPMILWKKHKRTRPNKQRRQKLKNQSEAAAANMLKLTCSNGFEQSTAPVAGSKTLDTSGKTGAVPLTKRQRRNQRQRLNKKRGMMAKQGTQLQPAVSGQGMLRSSAHNNVPNSGVQIVHVLSRPQGTSVHETAATGKLFQCIRTAPQPVVAAIVLQLWWHARRRPLSRTEIYAYHLARARIQPSQSKIECRLDMWHADGGHGSCFAFTHETRLYEELTSLLDSDD